MPTYEYQCNACNHEFEEFQRITAKPLVNCPACGKRKLRRLFGTGAAVVFKGSGFYQTDYRSDSYKKGADAAKQAKQGKSEGKKATEKKSGDNKPSSENKPSSDSKGSSSDSSGPKNIAVAVGE